MSNVAITEHAAADTDQLLDLVVGPLERPIAWHQGSCLSVGEFMRHVAGVAALLPPGRCAINLCEQRYHFLVAMCACLVRGVTTLLPPSRTVGVVAELVASEFGTFLIDDGDPDSRLDLVQKGISSLCLPGDLPQSDAPIPRIAAHQLAAIGYTSGSTGPPQAHLKRWGDFCVSTRQNLATLVSRVGATAHVLATVPAQHMYGMEMSVLLPLRGAISIHTGRPLFPADIQSALQQLPEPRVLVSTPVHLRALIQHHDLILPPIALVISATAPLSVDLARAVQSRFQTEVLELFGSTETCVLGSRMTATQTNWRRHDGVRFGPRPDSTLVKAKWLPQAVLLQDIIENLPRRRFRLSGRAGDHLEIAGKRASLAELTRRLLAIPGVTDGVVFQPERGHGQVQRVAALVVSEKLTSRQVIQALRDCVDPAFLPRPLRVVPELPRNATGKLPRQALLDLLDA